MITPSTTVIKHFNFLYIRKSEALSIISLICLYAIAEFGGISLLAPVLQYITRKGTVNTQGEFGPIWKILIRLTDFLGLPLNLAVLLIVVLLVVLARQLFFYFREVKSAEIRNRAVEKLKASQHSTSIRDFLTLD